jgi:hypothetical protein
MQRSGRWGRCAAAAVAEVVTPAGRTIYLCGTHARSWATQPLKTINKKASPGGANQTGQGHGPTPKKADHS